MLVPLPPHAQAYDIEELLFTAELREAAPAAGEEEAMTLLVL